MLTEPPVNAGTPRKGKDPVRSVLHDRLLHEQTLVAIGAMIDVASNGSGASTADLAEWLGTTLIRWAEQDRVKMRS